MPLSHSDTFVNHSTETYGLSPKLCITWDMHLSWSLPICPMPSPNFSFYFIIFKSRKKFKETHSNFPNLLCFISHNKEIPLKFIFCSSNLLTGSRNFQSSRKFKAWLQGGSLLSSNNFNEKQSRWAIAWRDHLSDLVYEQAALDQGSNHSNVLLSFWKPYVRG